MAATSTYIQNLADFTTVDYRGLITEHSPAVNEFYNLFTHPLVPIVAVILYWNFSSPVFDGIRKAFNIQPKAPGLQVFTALHSFVLAVYSLWSFVGSVRVVYPYVMTHGLNAALCDVNGTLWFDKGLGFWVTHFYISKFYEFFDTWIVLLKGRTPIFLQTYHHAGIVFLMWMFVVTANSSALIVIVLNAFIHTLMYSYYTLSAFGYSSPLKAYLTQAQMIQFLVGIACTVQFHSCANPAQSLTTGLLQLYAVVLIYLFYNFYVGNYKNKAATKKMAVE